MKGLIFDIHRFSLHDGPGIRTTVFLKGCPLRCLWCHNPESIDPRPQIVFHEDRCGDDVNCRETQRGLFEEFGGRHEAVHPATQEALSVEQCSHASIEVIGREMSVEEVMEEVLRDVDYYRRSMGGMTLSGGEPLYQPRFAATLLARARHAGIHTCVDTSGQVSQRRLADVAPETDLFLYDYKATDPEEHRRLTGVSNDIILQNLDFLYNSGAKIILRCPLVPGINDSREHLEGIALLSERYPDLVDVQVMPFHDMGRDKYRQLGQVNPLEGLPTADAVTKSGWIAALHRLGCTKAHLG